jgi:hypothetical protein
MTIWIWLKILFSTSLNVLDKCPDDLEFLEGRLDEENQNHKQGEAKWLY